MTGSSGWETGLFYRSKDIQAGEGILLVYSHSENVEFEVKLEQGDWYSEEYRRWGVYLMPQAWSQGYRTNVYEGTEQIGYDNLSGSIQIQPDNLYCMFLGIDEEQNFITIIWKKDRPNEYLYIVSENFEGESDLWGFAVSGNKGIFAIDSFTYLSFQN